jgi:hypothetical protein
MQKLLVLVGTMVGGSLGWAIGAPVGLMTAFLLGVVGTAVGLYLSRRVAQYLLL